MSPINDFQLLTGIHHYALAQKGTLVQYEWPEPDQATLEKSVPAVHQMLEAQQDSNRNEVILEISDRKIIGFRLDTDTLFLLMAEAHINIGLVRVAMKGLQRGLITLAAQLAHRQPANAEPSVRREPTTPRIEQVEPAKAALSSDALDSIVNALTEQVGPAAKIVFKREYQIWSSEGQQDHDRLPILLERIGTFIENPTKKSAFFNSTRHI
jgi:predicted regulator of Ras-like GTPase activity (Roadblock/LC7/MglB family)